MDESKTLELIKENNILKTKLLECESEIDRLKSILERTLEHINNYLRIS